MNHVNLPVIEWKPKICLICLVSWKFVPGKVWSKIVVTFMISDSRHEGCVRCETLSLLAIQIPNRLQLSNLFRTYPSVGNIASQEYKIIRSGSVLTCDHLADHMPKRYIGTHITKNCHSDLFNWSVSFRRSLEIFKLWVSSSFKITHLVVVLFLWFEVLHHCCVYATVKSEMSYVVGVCRGFWYLVEFCWINSELHSGLFVRFWVWYPHYLHFWLVFSESQMDLLVTWFELDLNIWKIQKLVNNNQTISIDIKGIEGRVQNVKCKGLLWFDQLEIIAELLPSDFLVLILVICKLKEQLNII